MFITIILAIIALLAILVITGKKSVHSELIVEAEAGQVWTILIDMAGYAEWNPTMQLVEGEVAEGNQVTYQFTQDEDNISNIAAQVVSVVPNELLNQKGGIPLILTFNHRYVLEAQGEQTKVIIHEDYAGIGVNFWNPAPVEAAYERLNQALKSRAEQK